VNLKPAAIDSDSDIPGDSVAADSSASKKTQVSIQQGERLPLSRYVLFFSPLVIGLVADLWTKSWMFKHHFNPVLAAEHFPQTKQWWIEGIFGIQTSTNPGALFGVGAGYSWLFAIFSVVALVGVLVWMFVVKAAYDRWLAWTVGMITGGILGNLYDRVGLGYVAGWPESIRTNVRDWILFELDGVPFFDPWPNFNIADCLLVCGAIMLLLHAFFMVEPDQITETD
jgi:signal peptidase II